MPKETRAQVIDELVFLYPTWFFEALVQFKGEPLVLEDFQLKYLLDQESRFRITNKTRQSGGSMQISMAKFFKAYRTPAYTCSIVSTNLDEAQGKIRYIRDFWDTLPPKYQIPLAVDNALSIGFHKGANKSLIKSVAAATGARGGSKEVVFDEFAHIDHAEDHYYAAAPAIVRNQYQLDLVSTPRGNLNMFAKIWKNEENEFGFKPFNEFSRHQFIWPDVRAFVTDFDKAQDVWYNEMREDMNQMRELVIAYGNDDLKRFYYQYPWNIFKQEFCGVFLDEISAFFPWSLIQQCLRGEVGEAHDGRVVYKQDALIPWTHKPEDNINEVYMGIDFGESDIDTDKTSIQVLEKDLKTGEFFHRYSEVLDKADLPDFYAQSEHIAQVARNLRPTRISGDFTGLGRGIFPILRRLLPDSNFEEVHFNPQTKEQMVMNLKSLMEQKKVWIQAGDKQLQGQIRNIQRDILPSGTNRYHGEPHDDMFWAFALAAKGGSFTPFAMYKIGSRARL